MQTEFSLRCLRSQQRNHDYEHKSLGQTVVVVG